MGFFAKKFAQEFEAELEYRLDKESEARENAKFLREMLQAERAEKLYWRSLCISMCPELDNKKGGKKNVQ